MSLILSAIIVMFLRSVVGFVAGALLVAVGMAIMDEGVGKTGLTMIVVGVILVWFSIK